MKAFVCGFMVVFVCCCWKRDKDTKTSQAILKFGFFTYRLEQGERVVFDEILPSWIAAEIPPSHCEKKNVNYSSSSFSFLYLCSPCAFRRVRITPTAIQNNRNLHKRKTKTKLQIPVSWQEKGSGALGRDCSAEKKTGFMPFCSNIEVESIFQALVLLLTLP